MYYDPGMDLADMEKAIDPFYEKQVPLSQLSESVMQAEKNAAQAAEMKLFATMYSGGMSSSSPAYWGKPIITKGMFSVPGMGWLDTFTAPTKPPEKVTIVLETLDGFRKPMEVVVGDPIFTNGIATSYFAGVGLLIEFRQVSPYLFKQAHLVPTANCIQPGG